MVLTKLYKIFTCDTPTLLINRPISNYSIYLKILSKNPSSKELLKSTTTILNLL